MLEVKKIRKSFGAHFVLRDVSFSVEDGRIYGLIGKNGAGKTTLLRIAAGLLQADAGECRASAEGSKEPVRVGYLPDIPSFFDYLSAKEYLDFLLMNKGPMAFAKRENLLKLAGLKGNERIHRMSRGMKQRLGIAAALVSDPAVLLLDEPTSALDPEGRLEFMELLNGLKDKGKSIILSTHILTDMERICDKAGFLQGGMIQREVKVYELKEGEENRWEIVFESEGKLPVYDRERLSVSPVQNGTYLFETEDQNYLLMYLAKVPFKIRSIQNKRRSLDEIFQEVCR